MSEATDILAVQLAASEASTKLSKMLDKVFSEKHILKRSHSNICDVLDNIRKELGVAHNFPKESLPGLIATLRDSRPVDPTVVCITELLEWLSAKGFLSPASISKEALLDTLNRIIERCLNAETDRYNLRRALEQERKKSEDFASRLNRVGLVHTAATAQLGAANVQIKHLENANASALDECESLTKRIAELEKQNSIMRGTVRDCSEARCKAEAEARMSTEHAANYHTQLHNIRCAMEAKGFPPGIDIASFIRDRLVRKELF